jgi:hypothetical protein
LQGGVPPPAELLALGTAVYVAVPAARARQVAYVLAEGARRLQERDGVAGLPWLDQVLRCLRAASEPGSEPRASVRGSTSRTDSASDADDETGWPHDFLTIARAVELTGRSPGYLARLARNGAVDGRKFGGAWHLERGSLLAFLARPRRRGSAALEDPGSEGAARGAP